MKIEWSTVVVVVALVVALVVLAALKVSPETLTALGALAVVVAGALKAMLGSGKPPTPPAVMVLVALACSTLAGCGPSLEATYTAALLRCVDKATTLAESRACRADVDRAYRVHGDAGDGAR